MLVNQGHGTGMRFVQGAVIQDKQAFVFVHKRVGLLPERLGIRRLSQKQAGVSVMGRGFVLRSTLAPRRFDQEKAVCAAKRNWM